MRISCSTWLIRLLQKASSVTLHIATSKLTVFLPSRLPGTGSLAQHFKVILRRRTDGTRTDKVELIAHVPECEQLPKEGTLTSAIRHDLIGAKRNGLDAWQWLWLWQF
jgi:phosphoglycolate phosphatase